MRIRKLSAALALVALLFSVTAAEARGGRTTAADCEAGSVDPECPDAPATQTKQSSAPNSAPQPSPPPRK